MTGQSLTKFTYNNFLEHISHIIHSCPVLLQAVAQFAQAQMDGNGNKTNMRAPHASTSRDLMPPQCFNITRLLCCIWRSKKVLKAKLHVWRHPPRSLAVGCLIFFEANLERARQHGVTRVDVNKIQEILSL